MSSELETNGPIVQGVLVTHGSMCVGMVDAVRKIAGPPADVIHAISNEGLGPEDLVSALLERTGKGPTIIFTDLQTGSCALAARFACKDPEYRRIVFGVNLPMLLDFVFHSHLPLDELVERLVQRGQSAIQSHQADVEERGDRSIPGR